MSHVNGSEMKRRISLRTKAKFYFELFVTNLSNGMKEYFSVRTRAAMRILGMLMDIGVWVIFAQLVGSQIQPRLMDYGTDDMVAFVLSGLIIRQLVELAQPINPFFLRGDYKTYHNTPLNLAVVAIIRNIDERYVWRLIELGSLLAIARLVFDVHIGFLSAAFWIVILLGSLFRAGLTLFTSGWVIVTKGEQDPISWFYTSTGRLLTGELFPITVLPIPLQWIAKIHPTTYVQLLARRTALSGENLDSIFRDALVLTLLSSTFFMLGYATLSLAIRRAKREGTMKW